MARIPSVKQYSFAGGEIAPSLFGRTDLERYRQSLQTALNFQITQTGSLQNRPGTRWIREVADSSYRHRLIPFVFNVTQAYVLELGEQTMRFYTNQGQVLGAEVGPVNHNGGNDSQTYDAGVSLSLTVDELVGGTIYNNTDGSSGVITANTDETITATLTGGTENRWDDSDQMTYRLPYEIATPWLSADLSKIKFAQRADLMVLTCPGYTPQVLTRQADNAWTITPYTVTRPVNPPTSVTQGSTLTTGQAQDRDWDWVVTSVDSARNESRVSALEAETGVALGATYVAATLTWTPPASGNEPISYNVYRGHGGVYGFIGSTKSASDGLIDEGAVPDYSDSPPEEDDPFVFSPQAANGEWREAEFSGGVAIKAEATEAGDDYYYYIFTLTFSDVGLIELDFDSRPTGGGGWTTHDTKIISAGVPITLQFTKAYVIDGAVADHEFRIVVQNSTNCTKTDEKVRWREAADAADEQATLPSAVAFFEQRLVYGGFTLNPQQIRGSRTGNLYNWDKRSPIRDDDAFDFTIASNYMDEIRDIISLNSLWAMTASGIWRLRGVDGGPLTPSSFDAKPHVGYGASDVRGIVLGDALLFVSERARTVREVITEEITDTIRSRDLTLLASHLLGRYEIEEWDFALYPEQIVYAVRSDGTLLAMTYYREQNLWGWTRHQTGTLDSDGNPDTGKFESIAVIPEGENHRAYAIVNRTIDGSTVRYVEVFEDRRQNDTDDQVFMDSAVTYDGRNTSATTLTVTGGDYSAGQSVTVTASAAAFDQRWEDDTDRLVLTGADGETCTIEVDTFTNTTSLTGTTITAVPASLQATATATWKRTVLTIYGLEHLEGEAVSLLVDSATHDAKTVSSGSITLDSYGGVVQIGLGYNCDMATMPLDVEGDEGATRKAKKSIQQVALELDNYRGVFVGTDFTDLEEAQARDVTDQYDAISPGSNIVVIYPPSTYARSIQAVLRQSDPLPITVASVLVGVNVGGNQ